MRKGFYFGGGLLMGFILACVACSTQPAYSNGPGPGPHPAIQQAIGTLQNARSILVQEAANDYQGHKANAIHYIDNALQELQICMSY